MKSILLFVCLAFLTSSLTCCRFDEESAPIHLISINGNWEVKEINTQRSNGNKLIEDSTLEFLPNERVICFNPHGNQYFEKEFGKIDKFGSFNNSESSVVIALPTDTINAEITHLNDSLLTLKISEQQNQELIIKTIHTRISNY